MNFVDIHTHHGDTPAGTTAIRSWRIGVEPRPAAPFSAGIHPWDAGRLPDAEVLLDSLAGSECEGLVAIGECGLDGRHNAENRAAQQLLFERQAAIASRLGLPVVIHCVAALEEVMATLAGYAFRGVIFHGYIGSPEQTAAVERAGYYISAGERSLRSPKTVEALRHFPAERILLETDDSAASIEDIYSSASTLLGIPPAELKARLWDNYLTLFGR